MLVLYSILLILLHQTDLLIGHGLMAENNRQYDRVAMPSFPVFWPHDRANHSYNNLLSKHGSFPRTLWTSKYFKFLNLSASRSRFRIPRTVETERYPFFLGKRITMPSFVARIRLGTTVRILFPSLSPLPIRLPFYCFLLLLAPWPTLLFPILLLPALHRSTMTTLGTTLRRRVP
jgi:hypothetical protein